jgi:hypothetical protein
VSDRENFERWAKSRDLDLVRRAKDDGISLPNGVYDSRVTRTAWEAWLAASQSTSEAKHGAS